MCAIAGAAMKVSKRRKWLILAVASALAVVAGASLYALWRFQHTPLRAFNEEDLRWFEGLIMGAEEFHKEMSAGKMPWRKADYSSVGFPEKEAKLRELRTAIELSQIRFGRLPNNPAELLDMIKVSEIRSDEKREYAELARECQIVVLAPDSYILNCNGWKLPNKAELSRLVESFDPDTEKFYLVQRHVILYAPSFVHGQPLPGQPEAKED